MFFIINKINDIRKVSIIYNTKVQILSKEEVAPNIFLIKLSVPSVSQDALPGQFIHIKCSKDNYPLLRRPISIHRIDKEKGEIYILFQAKGEGTNLLTQRAVGDDLDIMGPIGNGFTIYTESKKIIIVGGGIGVAPLLALTEKLLTEGKELLVLIGASKKEMVINEESIKNLGAKIEVATDDGSYMYKGLVTDLLEKTIKEGWLADQVFACGPKPMLRKVADITSRANIHCQVSLEERMGCGIGACMTCVCKIKIKIKEKQTDKEEYQYKRVCIDGPIFEASEVIWDD